jgi:hypothetical protein
MSRSRHPHIPAERRAQYGGKARAMVDKYLAAIDRLYRNNVQPGMVPILSSQMTALWDALCAAYRVLGFE